MSEIISGVLLIIGAGFNLVAAIGLLRFPDVYTRMHAASKAGTLGSGVMMIAIAVASGEFNVVTRSLAGVVFFVLTAPLSAHLLARAAYFSGIRPWEGTRVDELAGHYDVRFTKLSSADSEDG